MSESLEKMAEHIRQNFKECGSISFWGGNLVWPGDQLYRLKKVEVEGPNKLVILLDDGGPSALRVEVVDPEGVEIDKLGVLSISAASCLSLNKQKRLFRAADQPPALRLR